MIARSHENILAKIMESVLLSNRDAFVGSMKRVLVTNSDAFIDSFSRILPQFSPEQKIHLIKTICDGFSSKGPMTEVFEILEKYSGGHIFYSQEGEDILLARILDINQPSFFIDVGAHHPVRFSNTYQLYRKGWRGINIDPSPGCMDLFRSLRPEDINLEYAISMDEKPIPFFMFSEKALNTFDGQLAKEYLDKGWSLERTIEIQPRPLSDILRKYPEISKKVSLLSIDVEGFEMGVLSSNDWDLCAPDTIIIEALSTSLMSLDTFPPISFLKKKGYRPISKLTNSVILQRMG
jgi:FkbM family methyltransferase